ncbi:MAG: hypothetical protein IPM81_14265 [Saprospirales bacterium]|nr:hypothetical protein [Saprospirales bacterium]
MKFEIKKLSALCGRRVTVYSVALEDEEQTLFERFLHENQLNYPKELTDIKHQIRVISEYTGIRDKFFDKPEGKLGQDIWALYDKKGKLRLYCMQLGHVVIILGGGGPKTTRTLQEDPKLKIENDLMRMVSDAITQRMRDQEIRLPIDRIDLTGNLIFDDEDPMEIE